MSTVGYAVFCLLIDAAILFGFRRHKSVLRHTAWIVFAAAGFFVLAAGFGNGGFDVLRLYSWGVFGWLPALLIGSTVMAWRQSHRAAVAFGVAAIAILVVATDAFLIEPRWIEVTHFRLESAKLTRPLRIVILADFQTDRVGATEREALRLAMAERPDLVLLPGDFVQVEDSDERARVGADLAAAMREAGLDAPEGVFAVGGNTDSEDWPQIFRGLPVRGQVTPLVAETDRFILRNLASDESRRPDLRVPAERKFHIVQGHYPDFSLGDVQADLLVAGHTHGGQVRLPFVGPLLTLSRVPRRWAGGGVFDLGGGRTLVISRGIGMERADAPRLRFLCRPQVVVVDVVPAGR
ncbi:MAG: hypothetical protein HYY18_17200 [Planctomycetes bacterium]|nr:hypothetical protein [Planctomycetota bacterium]